MLLKRNVKELLTKEITIKINIMTENFKQSEFVCKCGKCKDIPEHLKDNIWYLSNELEKIRTALGKPIIINSGIRCVSHNKKIGGVKNSQHILGKAVDIRVKNMKAKDLYNFIKRLNSMKLVYIGYMQLYEKEGFVHYDIRDKK